MSKILKVFQSYITESSINPSIIKKLYNIIIRQESIGDAYDETNTNFIGSVTTSITYKKYIDKIKSKFPNLNISAESLYILFEYQLIEDKLKNLIGDGIGVSYDNAERKIISNTAIRNISTTFEFNEFKYFTATLQNPPNSLFYGCSGLVSIDCDNVLTKLTDSMFAECNKLTNLFGINNVTSAESNCFLWCNELYLTQQNFPSLIKIYNETFKNSVINGEWDLTNFEVVEGNPFTGSEVTKLIVPDKFVNTINIRNNYKLKTLVINTALRTNILDLSGCQALEPFILYYPLITQSFYNMATETWDSGRGELSYPHNWSHIYLPNITSTANPNMYYVHPGDFGSTFCGSRPSLTIDLVYFGSSLESMDYNGINQTTIKALVINRSTPPKIYNHTRYSSEYTEEYSFSMNYVNSSLFNIYVPDDAVETYKTAWPTHANNIFQISQLNLGVTYATKADWEAANKPIAIIDEYTH